MSDEDGWELSRRDAILGGGSALALWGSTQIAAAQGEPVYPSDVCTVVSNQHPDNEPDVTVDGCKLYVEVERDPERIWYTVKGMDTWEEITPNSDSQWTDSDGDGLLELPNDDGFDVSRGKVGTAPTDPHDVVRNEDLDNLASDGHDLGGSAHNADTLANVNSKVSDATLDDASEPRPPEDHDHQGDDLQPNSVLFTTANGDTYIVTTAGERLVVESTLTSQEVFVVGSRGIRLPHTGALTASTTVRDRSEIVECDTSGGSFTVTLGMELEQDGLPVVINDVGGNAGLQPISIEAESGASIDGSSQQSVNNDYGAATVYYESGRDAWYSISGSEMF